MKIINTKFKGLKIIKQDSFKDKRGYLRVTYNQKLIKKNNFVFEYCTNSKKNSLRGFHFQHKHQQAKYVSVIKGKILDCVIDLRKDSKTYCKIYKIILSDKNNLALYIPEGFAHAYYSYNKENDVVRIDLAVLSSNEKLEALSMVFSGQKNNAKLHVGWGYSRVEMPFTIL